jgi:hypothetical protein
MLGLQAGQGNFIGWRWTSSDVPSSRSRRGTARICAVQVEEDAWYSDAM